MDQQTNDMEAAEILERSVAGYMEVEQCGEADEAYKIYAKCSYACQI